MPTWKVSWPGTEFTTQLHRSLEALFASLGGELLHVTAFPLSFA